MKACPRCEAELAEAALGGISVDGCRNCGGIWFEHVELTVLARENTDRLGELEDRFQPSPADRKRQTRMSCPTCSVDLFEFEFKHAPGIRLDGCTKCKGIWVDDGELQMIQERLLSRAAAPAPAPTSPPQAPPATTRQRARQALGFISRVDCPNCREPNPAAGLLCWACGAGLKGKGASLCPHCDQPLQNRSDLGVRFDACSHCGGLWLDKGELQQLLKPSADEVRNLEERLAHADGGAGGVVPDFGTGLLCPICTVPIQTRQYAVDSGIYIDRCDQCRGAWVDSGELTRIARVLTPE